MPETTTPTPVEPMKPNVAAMLSYLLGALSGLYFVLTEKNDKFVRFHAFQSIYLSISGFVLSLVLGAVSFGILGLVVNLAWLGATILLMVKAYHNEKFLLPVIGDYAAKQA